MFKDATRNPDVTITSAKCTVFSRDLKRHPEGKG